MIVHIGDRSLVEARVQAQRWIDATNPNEETFIGNRTSAEDRFERERMRQKVHGTKLMRAAILAALERLRAGVLGATGIREDDEGESAKKKIDDALDAAAAWPDDLFSSAMDQVVRDLFDQAGESAAVELKTSFDVVPKDAIDAVLDEELAFSKTFVERERVALKSMLTQALENGTPVRELAEQIEDFFADGIHYVDASGAVTRVLPADSWAEQVARTETSRAYNAGHMATYAAAGVARIRWLTAADERVCPSCAALERKTTALGEPFPGTDVTEPPLHVSCAPAGTRVISARGVVPIETVDVGDLVLTHRNRFRRVRALSARDVSDDLVELQVGPHVLRVTEEHPILTRQGWAAAASLKPGDEICAVKAKPRLGLAGEAHDLPSDALQELFFGEVSGALLGRSVPATAVDLDRELTVRQRDVDAELVQGEVRDAFEACAAKGVDDDLFVAGVASVRPGAGRPSSGFGRALRSANRVVRGLGESFPVFGRRRGHTNEHRAASAAHPQAKANETARDRGARESRFARQCEHGYPLDVARVERAQLVIGEDLLGFSGSAQAGDLSGSTRYHIANVPLSSASRVAFNGTVYNFAVDEDESYLAEGIASHNCRCGIVAVNGSEA